MSAPRRERRPELEVMEHIDRLHEELEDLHLLGDILEPSTELDERRREELGAMLKRGLERLQGHIEVLIDVAQRR